MSMISELARELRRFAEDYEKEHVTLFGYRAKLLSDAADTIEALSAKLAEANMERSERYYGLNGIVEQLEHKADEANGKILLPTRLSCSFIILPH